MARTTIEIQAIINAGVPLAKLIKLAFAPDEPWTPKLALKLGYQMADFKKRVKGLYEFEDDVEFLHALGKYSVQDILDVYS